MLTGIRTLSLGAIKSSPEIDQWLLQFSPHQWTTAEMMLSRLWFVGRDVYSEWLKRELSLLDLQSKHAVYAVRKLDGTDPCYWQDDGTPTPRSGQSLGSEDLVYSIISNAGRISQGALLDHPSLAEIKEGKLRSFVLVDDSIGSGQRVVDFINAMLRHKQFMSWWSLGWVRIRVVAFARTYSAEKYIVRNIRGSDHPARIIPKSEKITFASELRYDANFLESRWGSGFQSIVDFCRSVTSIPTFMQDGFGGVMGNLVFYHSVPDNIPGMLWYGENGWLPLFPNRGLPVWMTDLLEHPAAERGYTAENGAPDTDLFRLIALIKSGVRTPLSISLRMNCDAPFALALIARAQRAGLVTANVRLTEAGADFFHETSRTSEVAVYDYAMYIPTSWSAG
ncbi:hypothetical protein QZM81_16305 [Burkholderia cepacia]|nr:hypothetical protein [Burkholderia cepacia]MDN7857365.1 hypothetical protein [Burkholderia cepacia]QFS40757.1 hypothetical protein BURCE16_28560 [Burkholderia cepacia]